MKSMHKSKSMKMPKMAKTQKMKKPKKTGMAPQYKPSTPPSKAESKTARPAKGRVLAEFPREPVNMMSAGGDLNAMARRRVKVTT